MLTFPVPIRIHATDDCDALQIVDLPAQIAVSLSGQYYIPMPAAHFAGCYGRTIILCKDIPYLKRVTENTCIATLLRDDRKIITTKCDMDYLLNPDFGEMAIYLDDGHVLVVSSEIDGQLIYGNRPPIQKKLEHFAKIMISCDSAFQTRGVWIPYSLQNCGGRVMEYQVEYPNSALLEARLRVQTWTTTKMGKEALEAPLAVAEDPLPPTLRSKLKDHVEGHTYRVPMTELVGRIKDRREALKRGASEMKGKAWHSLLNWPAFVALTVVVVVCVVIRLVACKMEAYDRGLHGGQNCTHERNEGGSLLPTDSRPLPRPLNYGQNIKRDVGDNDDHSDADSNHYVDEAKEKIPRAY